MSNEKFTPQPSEIQALIHTKYQHRKIDDELGFTGEYALCPKDVLDIIIDLQNPVSEDATK